MALTEFLLARIAEDECIARDWCHHPGKVQVIGGGTGYLRIANPARVLSECEAKRRIVELHGPHGADASAPPCRELASIAAVYADHPGLPRGVAALAPPRLPPQRPRRAHLLSAS